MTFDTLYGINGVGKDAIASELQHNYERDITITSASRLSMFLLGIIDDFSVERPVSRDNYKQLESVPQPEMVALEAGPYRDYLEKLSVESDKVLILSHLVFALHLDKAVTYLTDRHIPDWYVSANNNLVQLTAPPDEVLQRRRIDASRSRDRPTILAQVVEHQQLCDTEWDRIQAGTAEPVGGFYTVENINLVQATKEVNGILYE